MIVRTWTGRRRKQHEDKYLEYILRTGIEDFRSTPGNRGSWVLRRLEADYAEFVVVSLWDSMDSIRTFAGPDVEKARYYPEDDDYLLEKPEHVTHYEAAHQE